MYKRQVLGLGKLFGRRADKYKGVEVLNETAYTVLVYVEPLNKESRYFVHIFLCTGGLKVQGAGVDGGAEVQRQPMMAVNVSLRKELSPQPIEPGASLHIQRVRKRTTEGVQIDVFTASSQTRTFEQGRLVGELGW